MGSEPPRAKVSRIEQAHMYLDGELNEPSSTPATYGLLDRIFTDEAIGFAITNELVEDLRGRGAFADPNQPFPPSIMEQHPGPRESFADCHVYRRNERALARWINRFADILGKINRRPTRRGWAANQAGRPIAGGSVGGKPDVLSYLKSDLPGRLSSKTRFEWHHVQAFIELTSGKDKGPITYTAATKTWLLTEAQQLRTFVPVASFIRDKLRFTLFDKAGRQTEEFSLANHRRLTRLIAGLAFCSDADIGYDETAQWFQGVPVKIRVNDTDTWFTIVATLFFSPSIRGRSTIIYLVRDPDGYYAIVKDTWVDESRVNDEASLLAKATEAGVPHVPYLHSAWEVPARGVPDHTDNRRERDILKVQDQHSRRNNGRAVRERRYHRRILMGPVCVPIYLFKSLPELVSACIDIVTGHKALWNMGILHRDISLNNMALDDLSALLDHITSDEEESPSTSRRILSSMASTVKEIISRRTRRKPAPRSAPVTAITSRPSRHPRDSHPPNPRLLPHPSIPQNGGVVLRYRGGVLLDLDYAILFKTLERFISHHGWTGTFPFISMELLNPPTGDQLLREEPLVHSFKHDLESLLSVLLYMGSTLEGPGRPRIDKVPLLVHKWSGFQTDAADKGGLKASHLRDSCRAVTEQFTDYFKPLAKLCSELYDAIFPKDSAAREQQRASLSNVTHDAFIAIMRKHLAKLEKSEQKRKVDTVSGLQAHTSFTSYLLSSAHADAQTPVSVPHEVWQSEESSFA
ncbi:hypothetical protein BV25DRAFT_1921639 [Artomyces pyxidatus]|uniref:Uncharacterized protein n=1 Tax=Artomyces pyxidatus TaxID=48021 RepID=A0ACB8SH24_9AGAM|nr:hypothetical protein BV25DRAFT_1921639 [Artomyces pyxidatus]